MRNTTTFRRGAFGRRFVANVLFSERETECVYYLLRGMTAEEIGEKIHLSRRTVEGHISKVKRKLNCRKRSELITKIWEDGIEKWNGPNPAGEKDDSP